MGSRCCSETYNPELLTPLFSYYLSGNLFRFAGTFCSESFTYLTHLCNRQ